MRSDNGREYLSKDFSKFLGEHGIRRQLSTEYTPEQNGIAERANRSIVEMARCMLLGSGLPEFLWAEAVNCAAYLRNRSPTKILGDKTPYEVWRGIKPAVSHLKTFGCKAVMLDKRPGKPKFSARGLIGYMVGYSSESKAYRLYVPELRKIFKSRDVKFMENEGYKKAQSETTVDNKIILDFPIVRNVTNNLNFPDEDENLCNYFSTEENSMPETEDSEDSVENGSECIELDTGGDAIIGKGEKAADKGGSVGDTTGRITRSKARLLGKKNSELPGQFLGTAVSLDYEEYLAENPNSLDEALKSKDAGKWIESMKKEYNALLANNTWDLVDRPKQQHVIKSKWVFNIKRRKDGSIERYKSRLVAKGCNQRYGVDYRETFSPVTRYSTVRLILALAAEFNLFVHQLDVTSAYLNGDLQEEVYMEQPEYFIDRNQPNKVCKLKRALYGLKQAGREWNGKLDSVLRDLGFQRCNGDTCVYIMNNGKEINIVVVYVDDILLACSQRMKLNHIKQLISSIFSIVDMGPVDYFLGMEIERDREQGIIKVSQSQFIRNLLCSMGMQSTRRAFTPLDPGQKFVRCKDCTNCVKVDPKMYQSLIGSLMYLGIVTRPDIIHSVSKLAQFNNDPHHEHFTAVKHLLRYLNDTIDFKLHYEKTGKQLEGYADGDWAAGCDDRKSYTGFAIFVAGGPISWESRKQSTVALSSTEAEYMALSAASKEAVYLRTLIAEVGFPGLVKDPTTIGCDNLSAQQLVKNPVFHSRSKHIDIRFHFIREVYQKNLIDLKYVPTEEMVADVFTKNLRKKKHIDLTLMLGISSY